MNDVRRDARRRVLKGAQIVLNEGRSVIDCRMRNASEGGATLEVDSLAGIPDEFALRSSEGRRSCRVAWRRPGRIGVAFLEGPPR